MLKIEDLNFDVLFPQTVFDNKSVKVVHFNNPNNRDQMYINMYPIDRGIPCAAAGRCKGFAPRPRRGPSRCRRGSADS